MSKYCHLAIVTFIICMIFSLRRRPGAVDGQPFAFTFGELREFIELERSMEVRNCTVLVACICSSVIIN